MLNSRSLKLTLLMLVIARPALSHVDLGGVSKLTDTSLRQPVDELDAKEANDCFSLGELDIAFRTHNNGEPNVGVVLTDPHGRRIGFDPLTKHAWQELPVAQGYIDCDASDGIDACQGLVQICGAVSGAYQLEVIAQQTTTYSVNIFGRSKTVLDGGRLQFSRSERDLNNLAIREGSRDIVLLKYSRDPQRKVTSELQRPLKAQGHDAGFHLQGTMREGSLKSECN